MRVVVRGVKQYRSKGRTYCYHRATGTRINAAVGTAEFFAEIASLNKATKKQKPVAGTLGALFAEYRASDRFTGILAPRTREDYQKVMNWLAPMSALPLSQINPVFTRQLRDKAYKAKGYRFANYVLSVVSAALTWGAKYGHLESNPIKGQVEKADRPKNMRRRNRPWTMQEREIVLAQAPLQLKVPLALMRWCGLRTGDVLTAPRTAYDGTAIEIRTSKTGQLVWLPCPRPLRLVLDQAKNRWPHAKTLAVSSDGLPWTGNGFRSSLAKLLRRMAAKGEVGQWLSPHGLRHSVAVDLRELGYDERSIADFLGQAEIETARGYARGADLKRKMTAIVKKFERKK